MAQGKNIDDFNVIVGLIFDQLYAEFPTPVSIDEKLIAEAMKIDVVDDTPADWPSSAPRVLNYGNLPSGTPFRVLLYPALNWLRNEAFVTGDGEYCTERVTLTAKALLVMNASPTSLEPSLGSKLSTAVSDVGKEGGRAAIAEVVGQIMGGAIKVFSQGG